MQHDHTVTLLKLTDLAAWIVASHLVWASIIFSNFIASALTGIHAANRKETAWTLVIIFFPFIGWIAYWLRRREPGVDSTSLNPSATPGPAAYAETPDQIAQRVADSMRKKRPN